MKYLDPPEEFLHRRFDHLMQEPAMKVLRYADIEAIRRDDELGFRDIERRLECETCVLKEVGENVTDVILSSDGSWKALMESDDPTGNSPINKPDISKNETMLSYSNSISSSTADILDLTEIHDAMDVVATGEFEDHKSIDGVSEPGSTSLMLSPVLTNALIQASVIVSMTIGELLLRVGDSAREKPNNSGADNDHRVLQLYLDFQASAMNTTAYLCRPIGNLLKELSTKCERLVVVNDALMVNTVKDWLSIQSSCFPLPLSQGGGGVNTAKMPRHLTRRCSVSLRPRRKRRWPLLLGAVGKNQEENTAVTAPESFYPAMAAERNLSPVNRRIEPCRSCPFRRRSIHLLFTEGERASEAPAAIDGCRGGVLQQQASVSDGGDGRSGVATTVMAMVWAPVTACRLPTFEDVIMAVTTTELINGVGDPGSGKQSSW
nr:E4 SUMO-protein ligase PIAL2-like isoform X2 [Ipomoea batatas]